MRLKRLVGQKTAIDLEKVRRKRADQLPRSTRKIPKQTKVMTSLLSLLVLVSLFLTRCSASASTTALAEQPPIRFIRTVQVTPDDQFLTGSFARINYVPATDRFVVTFGTKASTEPNTPLGAGFAYKEYTIDMQDTGKTGLFEWYANNSESGDMGSCMVNNTYYCAFMSQENEPYGWRLVRYDAASWARLNQISVSIQSPNEGNADPMVAYVNGQLDVSDQYNPAGIQPEGNSSLHRFFTADLQLIGMRELNDTANVVGSSMMFVDGIYYFVTANNFFGDLVLMKYDVNWHYLGMKYLIQQAHWSTGMTYDGEYFYLAYLNTSQRTPITFFPVYPNVHLAVFDRDWNLKYDQAITNFTLASDHKGGRPWVMLHGNRLYVSYDVDSVNKTTEANDPSVDPEEHKWQAYVSIYEISQPAHGGAWWLWPISAAGIVIVAIIAVIYVLLKRHGRRTKQEEATKPRSQPTRKPPAISAHDRLATADAKRNPRKRPSKKVRARANS